MWAGGCGVLISFADALRRSDQTDPSFYAYYVKLEKTHVHLLSPAQVAKAAYQRNNDPLDAALFYLAMKKKAVVWGLYR